MTLPCKHRHSPEWEAAVRLYYWLLAVAAGDIHCQRQRGFSNVVFWDALTNRVSIDPLPSSLLSLFSLVLSSWMIVNRTVVVKSCIWKQCDFIAWVCWVRLWSCWVGLIKFVIACHALWDQPCCYFWHTVLHVCVIHKCKFIMHSTISWLTLKQYVFCKDKDNRLVLIVECLFAKASTSNASAWAREAPPSSPGATAHFHLKQHTHIRAFGLIPLKWPF